MADFSAPLRLRLDGDALLANWRWLKRLGGAAACGAAIKANGYGLGSTAVMRRLLEVGCRDFFVSNWAEAAVLEPLVGEGVSLSVLHGVREEDMTVALASRARPVLCTEGQIARWRAADGGPCDVMVDTGMNRLGLDWRGDVSAQVARLDIVTLHSHLASADEDTPLSRDQLERFSALRSQVKAARYSLANSAGICLGAAYAFDMTRPGIALYGGVPREEAAGHIRQVVFPEAQVLQRRRVRTGDTIGYNATHRAATEMEIASKLSRTLVPAMQDFHRRNELTSLRERLNAAQQENQLLEKRLAERKLVERAKGLLQLHYGWTEEDAYYHLRRTSRQQRTPMAAIAQRIIDVTAPKETARERLSA